MRKSTQIQGRTKNCVLFLKEQHVSSRTPSEFKGLHYLKKYSSWTVLTEAPLLRWNHSCPDQGFQKLSLSGQEFCWLNQPWRRKPCSWTNHQLEETEVVQIFSLEVATTVCIPWEYVYLFLSISLLLLVLFPGVAKKKIQWIISLFNHSACGHISFQPVWSFLLC